MRHHDARATLRDFLDHHGITFSGAAMALSVSVATISQWISGARRPGATHREAIDRWTGGRVPRAAWGGGDLAYLERIEPHSSTVTTDS